jgi:hypothetical protein
MVRYNADKCNRGRRKQTCTYAYSGLTRHNADRDANLRHRLEAARH